MKVSYDTPTGHYEIPLSQYLKPTNTGSTQGAVEQLEAEVDVLKNSVGMLLAMLVENSKLSLEDAEEVAGIHFSYKQYHFKNFRLY